MKRRLNILLITIDTLRADHLGCYGYHRDTSPSMDALASEGVLCERFYCAGIPTQPSYTSLYTGQHAITHGIVAQGGDAELDRQVPFLPEVFARAGYVTCAVDNLKRARSWFGRGYEFYIDPSLRRRLFIAVTCEEINRRTVPWLRAHADEPFFLLLHYWDPHSPYVTPPCYHHLFYQGNPTDPNNSSLNSFWEHPMGAFARETWLRTKEGLITDLEYVKALYDQEVRYLDDAVGELLDELDRLGLSEQTLVVLVADHGENLGEHGGLTEHCGLYDDTQHVPLIIRLPGSLTPGKRLPHVLQHHDVAPTLIDAAGLPIPPEMEGRSFWKLFKGEEQEGGRQAIVSCECTWEAMWSLRTSDFKFILARDVGIRGGLPRELYDLRADPREEHNVAEERPEIAAAMEAELERWIARRLQILGKRKDPLQEQGISVDLSVFRESGACYRGSDRRSTC